MFQLLFSFPLLLRVRLAQHRCACSQQPCGSCAAEAPAARLGLLLPCLLQPPLVRQLQCWEIPPWVTAGSQQLEEAPSTEITPGPR